MLSPYLLHINYFKDYYKNNIYYLITYKIIINFNNIY